MTNHLFDQLKVSARPLDRVLLAEPDGSIMTYGEAAACSGQLATALRSLGVSVGDRVAVQAEKSPYYLMTYLACLRAGAVFVPLNTAYTDAEIGYFVSDAEPKLLVTSPERQVVAEGIMAAIGGRVATMAADGSGTLRSEAHRNGASFSNAERGPDDLAALLYTSGTTGRSKGAMLSHENLASNARTLVTAWQFSETDRLLHALPIFHTHGLFVATNTTLMAGGAMNFMAKFDADQTIEWLPKSTAMMGVPTFYVRLLQHPDLNQELTRSIRLFISGSAPLLAETHTQWQKRTGHAILERYGMTETNMLTSNPYEGARVPGAVGPPLPGVEARITDPDSGTEVRDCGIGMIEVRGPNVFKGYWRNNEATKESFRPDGYFITGDLGFKDKSGYFHIVGRSKDLVISGGFNVYPKEIETEIDALPGVFESAVFGVPHRDFGEGVTAVVVRVPNSTISESDIRTALKDRLANYKLPKRVLFADDLPRNAMGKVQKNVLRDQHCRLYETSA